MHHNAQVAGKVLAAEADGMALEALGVRAKAKILLLETRPVGVVTDLDLMERKFRECVAKCGATLLHIHLHHFTPNGGISGVAVLAESHISVHTWPERGYAAFDIFMCGDAQPEKAIPILKGAFKPERIMVGEQLRGVTQSATEN